MAKELIASGADVNATTKHGYTRLCAAARKGHSDIVQLFVSGGKYLSTTYKSPVTLLALAATEGHLDVVKILVANIADEGAAQDDLSNALLIAKKLNHKAVADYLSSLSV